MAICVSCCPLILAARFLYTRGCLTLGIACRGIRTLRPMLGFLQGFSYGLFMTCLPWLLVGLANPRLAVPLAAPSRWQVIARYCLLFPFISVLLWLTSLWGGFSPSLFGWLVGLAAIGISLPVERRLRGWWGRLREQRRQAQLAREARRQRAEQE